MSWAKQKGELRDLDQVGIKYKKGDILKALETHEIDIMGHGVNCQNGFGSGIAGQIAKKYPAIKREFHLAHDNFDYGLGDCQLCCVEEGMEIANCYTQSNYGYDGKKYVSYDAIESSLKELHKHAKRYRLTVGLPKIGCGLAGGNWNIVESIINEVFNDMEVTVYEFTS